MTPRQNPFSGISAISLMLLITLLYGSSLLTGVWYARSETALPALSDRPSERPENSQTVSGRTSIPASEPRTSETSASFSERLQIPGFLFLMATTVTGIFVGLVQRRVSKSSDQLQKLTDTITSRIVGYSEELAEATRQTSLSIDEIARCSGVAVASLSSAMQSAEQSGRIVESLNEHTESVSLLIAEITSISEQTNLLALNATIESARAGEAGKGFSVVANEVKQLANVTHTTADNVIKRVRCIQQSSHDTIQSTRNVRNQISQTHDSQGTIASAVEEQRSIVAQLACQAQTLADEARNLTTGIRTDNSAGQPAVRSVQSFNQQLTTTTGKPILRKTRIRSFTLSGS